MINQLTTLKQQRRIKTCHVEHEQQWVKWSTNPHGLKLMEIIEANNEYLINLDKVIVMIEKHLRGTI